MTERGMRIGVGLFVLAGLILLGVLTFLFSGFSVSLGNYDQYTVEFQDASGVGRGTPVRRAGIRVGQVKDVQLDDPRGLVRVVLEVDKQHPPRRGDDVTLVRGILGSDPAIDFIPKTVPAGQQPDQTPVPPGEVIAGTQGADVRNLINQTRELVPSTQETLNDIRKSLKRFEEMAPLVEDTLKEYKELAKASRDAIPDLKKTNDEIQVATRNWSRLGERLDVLVQTNQDKVLKTIDNINETVLRVGNVLSDENQRNITATIKNVRTGTDRLDEISKNTDQLLKQGQQSLEQFNKSLVRADDVLANLQVATKPMADRSAAILQNMEEITVRLNRVLADLVSLLGGVNQNDGTIRRLLTDPTLFNNLNDAACMLARLMPRLDRILKDVEVFADKIARHPESLGVRGAVSPGSGLKESPNGSTMWKR